MLRGLTSADLRLQLMTHQMSSADKDAATGALVRIGRTDVQARVAVVACLLPGLRAKARRFAGVLGPAETWGELLAALWARLATYDITRRPHRIAANLLWDAAHDLLQRIEGERRWQDTFELTDRIEALARKSSLAELDPMADAVAAGQASPLDATLVRSTRLDGVDLATAAHLMGLSYEAAKKRRRRAEVAWAAWWAPDLHKRMTA